MYHEYFGLRQAPFRITPDTRLFYDGGRRGEILDALVYAISSGEGVVKVVGEVGSGKTMLCRMLEVKLPRNIEIVYLANPSLSPEDILHAIALEMNLDVAPDANRLQVMHALQQRLLEKHAEGRQVVVFVEEAQSMPVSTLEEIRLLSNLETEREKLLQIVLFGQPELDRNLEAPAIRQLKERITHSFRLEPFTKDEVEQYIAFRLRAVGYRGPDVFSTAAHRKLVRTSEGLSRRINILADKALLAAFADNTHNVTPRHVRVAITDSEFHRRGGRGARIALVGGVVIGGAVIAAALLGRGPLASGVASLVRAAPPSVGARLPENRRSAEAAAPAANGATAVPASVRPGAAPSDPVRASTQPAKNPAAETTAAMHASTTVRAVAPAAENVAAAAAPTEAASAAGAGRASAGGADAPGIAPTLASPVDPAAGSVPTAQAAAHAEPASTAGKAGVERSADARPRPDAQSSPPSAGAAATAQRPASSVVNSPEAVTSVAVKGQTPSQNQAIASRSGGNSAAPEVGTDVPTLLAQRLQATKRWLAASPGDRYSIQLLVTDASNEGHLERYLAARQRQGELGRIYVYRTTIKGHAWFGVLYDDFGTYAAANRALQALPAELRRSKPYVRKVRDIGGAG